MEQKFVATFAQFSVLVVFANVLLDQIGLPLPAMPTLILIGAIAANSTLSVIDWGEAPVVRLFNAHGHLGWREARWMNQRDR